MCQICTVAIIGGLGLSRWLKVDDTVSGVWIGALLVTIIYYSVRFLENRKIRFLGRDFLTALVYYAAAILPLYYYDIIGHPANRVWLIDKFLVGIVAGSVIFTLSVILYSWMKKKNGGHAHFPMEKVIIPIVALIIVSGIFYLLTKQNI